MGSWLARLAHQGKSLVLGRKARHPATLAAQELYGRAVAQSRAPTFYLAYGVPDTHDGRLELIQLHVILLLRRLQRGDAASQAIGQALFDVLFDDVDRSLREGGVGDLVVGKWVKKIARQFYARAAAVEGALEIGDGALLASIVAENVYGGAAGGGPLRLAAYLLAVDGALAAAAAAEPEPTRAVHFPPVARIDTGSDAAALTRAAS